MDKHLQLLTEIRDSLVRIEAMLRAQAKAENYDQDTCPQCYSSDLIDASTMGNERLICRNCESVLKKEAVRG